MNEFNFGRKVKIQGVEYTMDLDQDLTEVTESIQAIQQGDSIVMAEACIDTLMGKGAFNRIFDGRTPTDKAVGKLLSFLAEEILQETAEMKAQKKKMDLLVSGKKRSTK